MTVSFGRLEAVSTFIMSASLLFAVWNVLLTQSLLDTTAQRVEKEGRKRMEKRLNNMEKIPNHREPLLTTEATSKWLGVSTRTLCLWAECQEIPAFKVGRQWRFRESELAKWLEDSGPLKVRKPTFIHAGHGSI